MPPDTPYMRRVYSSACDDEHALVEIEALRRQIEATLALQGAARGWLARLRVVRERLAREAEERARELAEAEARALEVEGADASEDDAHIFVIRNLDTGEAARVPIEEIAGADGEGAASDKLRSRLSLGTLMSGTAEWEATKADCCGLIEKLAVKSSLSFRSYTLCVWQERWVFAEDDSLCYQHLNADRMPSGAPKRIYYSSIQFVGPYDETQFVVLCARRSFTFLCETTEDRTRWIKNISLLAGCSASTQMCGHTTRRLPMSRAKGKRAANAPSVA